MMATTLASRTRRVVPGIDRGDLDVDLWDVAALLALLFSTLALVGSDGGRPVRVLLPGLVLGAVVAATSLPHLRRLPRWLLVMLALWLLGPLVSLAFAEIRAGWVRPVAVWTLAGVTFIAATRVLQRRWGTSALLLLVGATLARGWYHGLLVWWAGGTSRGEPAWMALSWHNQSGTLMAVFGVGGLGLALTTAGKVRGAAIVGAAAGLAGAWLSASRGAVAVMVLGLIIVAVGATRRGMGRPTYVTLATVMLSSITLISALSAIWGTALSDASRTLESAPITAREQDAVGNLQARVGHWEAAVRMFAANPLTGTGPGSYRWSSIPVYPEDTNLTSSAHGEQLEALGEQGLLGGAIAIIATVGLAWLVLTTVARPGSRRDELAACGALTVLLGHAAIDFDWTYALLLTLAAVAAALLIDARSDRPAEGSRPGRAGRVAAPASTWLAGSLIFAALLASAVSLTGILVQGGGDAPWLVDSRTSRAVAVAAHNPDAAERELATVRRWNPGVPGLGEVAALVSHATGATSDLELRAAIDPERSPAPDQLQAARQLLDAGRPDLSLEVLTDLQPVLDHRRAWGVREGVAANAGLQVAAAHLQGGCRAVERRLTELLPWSVGHDISVDEFERFDVWGDCGRR